VTPPGQREFKCPECETETVLFRVKNCLCTSCGREWPFYWCIGVNIAPVTIARIRRGKYVRIPAEWRGQTTTDQTKRRRKRREPRELTNQERRALDNDDQLR
jgi:hypothetical protein